ncbi:universal stress protein [Neoaquamicrobium microcysteis]|nr:universal stress protein [Mesorhizobium microcysteis]
MDEKGRLVCCVNGSSHSARAVELSCLLAPVLGLELTFALVNQTRPASGHSDIRSWSDEEARHILDTCLTYARAKGLRKAYAKKIEAAGISTAILEYAHEQKVLHIVVGTGNPPFIGRLLMGSVSEAIVARAPCSVTIAR